MLKCVARVALLVAIASPAAAQAVRTVPVNANDLAYSPLTGRLYASVTATNSITEIDPVTGTVGVSFVVGSQPNKLAISDTGEYLFVGLDGAPAVVRVHLPTRTLGTPFPLGAPDPFFGPKSADDLAVMPGNPNAVAVALRYTSVSPKHAGVAVFEGGVQRPTVTPGHTGSNAIVFGASADRLYGLNTETSEFGFRRMAVTASGVTILESTAGLINFYNTDIEYFGGRVYSTSGRVIDAEAHAGLATFSGLGSFGNALEPTATRIYYVTEGSGAWRLKGYDPATFVATFDGPVPGVSGTPRVLVSAGPDLLALATSASQVILIAPDSGPPAAPAVTITGPTSTPTLAAEASAITLTGTATDPNLNVTGVTWTSNRGYSGTANGTAAWTAGDIPLLLGSNQITVTAIDDTGLAATDTVDVTVTAFSSFLAEGATGDFFDYDLALANPSMASVDAEITYFPPTGATVTQTVTLPAESRRTIRVDDVAGLERTAMSTSVRTTTAPIVVERTMRWGQAPDPQYGAHTDRATAGTALKWYFAEGAQGFFHTYVLLANPGNTANTATIDWLIEGTGSVQRTVNLPPASRTTIYAGADDALVNRSFGIVVTFAQPAVAERAMYFGTPPDVLFKAGHDSAGVTAPSTRWILAEGATGPFFETFILLANPNPTQADATLEFLTQTGVVVQRTVSIPALGRRTVDIEGLSPAAPELTNAAVATVVTASQPIVAERAQYWPGVGLEWYEAHNSFGLTAPSTKWGLAEGRVGDPPGVPAAGYQTYILLANPGTPAAAVTITFLRETGAPIVRTFIVFGHSRLNVAVGGIGSTVPELANEMFGARIESTLPIVVERALYGNAGTQVFGIGTNATATPLP
ncbi:MAG: hypothetical protein ACHQRO_02140 [Vicinamibacteria bacterium]